jgi:ubiquinone/menaquinone biosynthesis C-methylase UbiE
MLLNRVERIVTNSPLRAWSQRRIEAPMLERFGGRVKDGRALELGCGRGIGTEIILERFQAGQVRAFDLDPEMVARARRRLSRYGPERLVLYQGDATSIPEGDRTFDAVFEFGIIHHVPEWTDAIGEVRRVLRTGGRFYFVEVTRKALNRWLIRTFLEHPRKKRFSAEEFIVECERQGLTVGQRWKALAGGDFLIGVATRTG